MVYVVYTVCVAPKVFDLIVWAHAAFRFYLITLILYSHTNTSGFKAVLATSCRAAAAVAAVAGPAGDL